MNEIDIRAQLLGQMGELQEEEKIISGIELVQELEWTVSTPVLSFFCC